MLLLLNGQIHVASNTVKPYHMSGGYNKTKCGIESRMGCLTSIYKCDLSGVHKYFLPYSVQTEDLQRVSVG